MAELLTDADKALLSLKCGLVSVPEGKPAAAKEEPRPAPSGPLDSDDKPASNPPIEVEEEPTDKDLEDALKPREDISKYKKMDFEDAVDMLCFLDESLGSGQRVLHPWQMETLVFLSRTKFTTKIPLRFYMAAANGSGKDAYVNAPIALFLTLCKIRHRCIITSSSYNQLKTQTQSYLRSLCSRANAKLAEMGISEKAFLIKRDHIVCTLTGSEIVLFVTDDPGKAEGFHPFPDYAEAELCIIINEAKSINADISDALSRCTFNRWIEISSPGSTNGRFYNSIKSGLHYPAPFVAGIKYCRRVTSFDCPHISREKIEQDRLEYGENSIIFRSKHLAEFTSIDENVVVTREAIQKCLNLSKDKIDIGLPVRAGLDLAGGGDENALYVFDNNVCIGHETFRARDTDGVTINALIAFFHKYNLKAENIFADDGGIGQGILDNLAGKGWPVNRVRNQWSPIVKNGMYGNRGAELWFNFARFVQECIVVLPSDDTTLHDQLSSRFYRQGETNGKLFLESKAEARLKGHGSPDRADGVVLAFTGLTIADFRGENVKSTKIKIKSYEESLMEAKDRQFEHLRTPMKSITRTISYRNVGNLFNKIYERK